MLPRDSVMAEREYLALYVVGNASAYWISVGKLTRVSRGLK